MGKHNVMKGSLENGSETPSLRSVETFQHSSLATVDGWRVLEFSTDMLRCDPQGCIEQLRQVSDGGNETGNATEM